MKISIVILITLCLLFISGCQSSKEDKRADKVPKKPIMKIFLCIGQSNMAGRGEIKGMDTVTLVKVFLFNDSSKWEPAKNPLNKYSTVRKDLEMQKLSPAWTFAISCQKHLDAEVGLVVNAKGGTKIKEWMPGTPFYNEAIIRALKAQKSSEIIGVIWHQGESDRSSSTSYAESFRQIVKAIRTDLDIPNLPVVVGQISKAKESSASINEVLKHLEIEIPNVKCVSSDGLSHVGDSTHFDTEAQRELGRRYAEAMIQIQKDSK